MSSYEDYSSTSAHYDATRAAIGVEVILGCLARGGRPLSGQVLLDAGCGTGNYSAALIDHVARIEAVDMNEGMLGVAREKLAGPEAEGRIRFQQGSIDQLPLPSASVDGVMINQVLHHLPDVAAEGWPLTRKVIGEFARVLRPGGALTVNFCSHEQLRRGWWVYALIPQEVERMVERHVPLDDLEAMASEAGFDSVRRFVPTDAVLQGESYFDLSGPLNPTWRAGDSVWAELGPDGLEAVEDRVRGMLEKGEMETFVRENDASRLHIGQTTFICASRP